MKKFTILILCTLIGISSCRRSDYFIEYNEEITDLGGGTGTVTWTKDKSYTINGFVFVNDGQVLTIEAGTVIKAKTGQGSMASALIVARGAQIIAEGTNTEPIIFTVEGDDLEGSVPVEARGLWGGLIILGNATVNTDNGEDMIEGIPVSETRGIYGGLNDDDNSGILRYVSIRHGGTNIGEGNEINGLTLGGVGRKTIIDHVEVISNEDDGVEIFGGSVNCKNLVVSYCGDDAFDIDQGYKGKCQFLLGVNCLSSDKGLEISGGLSPLQILPGSIPEFYNLTLIGKQTDDNQQIINFSSFGGGHIANSIFSYPGQGIGVANVKNQADSYSLFENGSLSLKNNIFFPEQTSLSITCFNQALEDMPAYTAILSDSLNLWNNKYEMPMIITEQEFNLLPMYTQFDQLSDYSSDWYEKVTYKGAFGSDLWIEGWTLLWEYLSE